MNFIQLTDRDDDDAIIINKDEISMAFNIEHEEYGKTTYVILKAPLPNERYDFFVKEDLDSVFSLLNR